MIEWIVDIMKRIFWYLHQLENRVLEYLDVRAEWRVVIGFKCYRFVILYKCVCRYVYIIIQLLYLVLITSFLDIFSLYTQNDCPDMSQNYYLGNTIRDWSKFLFGNEILKKLTNKMLKIYKLYSYCFESNAMDLIYLCSQVIITLNKVTGSGSL